MNYKIRGIRKALRRCRIVDGIVAIHGLGHKPRAYFLVRVDVVSPPACMEKIIIAHEMVQLIIAMRRFLNNMVQERVCA
jgi:hypothetical protein